MSDEFVHLDLCCGGFGWSRAIPEGAECIGVDIVDIDTATLQKGERYVKWDLLTMDVEMLVHRFLYRSIDLITFSPPCRCFSIASCSTHWEYMPNEWLLPKTEGAEEACRIVLAGIEIIKRLRPAHWVIENPRGMLRKMPFMKSLVIRDQFFGNPTEIWWCQYGDRAAKPTDLWMSASMAAAFDPRTCSNGASLRGECHHEAAPRGSKTGTQGKHRKDRARIPYLLSAAIYDAAGARE